MSFDPAVVPVLVPFPLDSSYGLDASVVLKGNPLYFSFNYDVGNFVLEPTANLKAIADIARRGIVAITTVGSAAAAIQLVEGTGIAISDPGIGGGDVTFSSVAGTSVQQHILNVNGVEIGTSTKLDIIPGDGVDILGFNNGFENQVTISMTDAISSDDYFVVTRAAGDLPNSTNLGALTTGLLKNTVSGSAATLSRAVPATTSAANDYQAGSAQLTQLAALSPSNGQSFYYTGGAWTMASGMAFLSAIQTWTAVQTFTPTAVFTGSIKIPTGAGVGKVLISDGTGIGSWSTAGAGDVTLAGTNAFTGTNTFNSNLPTSSQTPTLPTQFVTKEYTDDTFGSLTAIQTWSLVNTFSQQVVFTNSIQIPLGAADGYVFKSDASGNGTWAIGGSGDALLAGSNVYTGTNVFNANLPTSTATPTLSTELITKAFADATYGSLTGIQTWTAVNTFTPQAVFTNSIKIPLSAGVGKVLGSDASGNATWTTAGAGDVTLAGVNNFAGTNTFNVNLPSSTQTPTLSTQLVTKAYVDGLQPLTGAVTTAGATPTTLATIAIASNTAVTINGIVTARNSSGTINNTTGGRFTCTAVNTAGTVALAATPDVTVQATSTGTFNVVVSGTNLIVQVTGIAATPYTWSTVYTTLAL